MDDILDRYNLALVSPRFNMLIEDANRSLEAGTLSSLRPGLLDWQALEPILRGLPVIKQLNLSDAIRRLGPDSHFNLTDNCSLLTTLSLKRTSFAPTELAMIVTKCNKYITLQRLH